MPATQTSLPTQAEEATAPTLPTATSRAATVAPTIPSGTSLTTLNNIHMLDAQDGWAGTMDGQLLHTADGGRTWIDRTPTGYQHGEGFFLDALHAWLPVYLADANRFGLLYTADGGQSWVQYPYGPASGLHFANTMDGWAVTADVGAGNVYFSLYQSSDGGKIWMPIPAKPPSPEPGLPPGTIHLCNICNDAFHYDPLRMVIVYGDLGSMESGGAVRLEVSFDLGNTWQSQDLPLPQGETGALVAPNPPVFFADGQGILPVHLLKMGADGSYSEQKLVFYTTPDGGASWTQLPTLLDAVPPYESVQVDASGDVFIICGNNLCASHDVARTWQTLSSNLDFAPSENRSVSAIDFVNGATGWALVQGSEVSSLYHTTDGGLDWEPLSPLLLPSTPPAVTIDTGIPTPTVVPTPG